MYCDFYSQVDLSLIHPYLDALKKEIQDSAGSGKKIQTLYFGGGTPSVLTAFQIEQIMNEIQSRFRLCSDPEITVEVNPKTINQTKLNDYFSLGINRLSIGVQSFDDGKLKFLSRVHTAAHARDAVRSAHRAGFENIGLDLIYGLPDESKTRWQADLDAAISLSPVHLSCYLLTVEPSTLLHEAVENGHVRPLTSDRQSQLFYHTADVLIRNGFEHYEISNFSRGSQNRSVHNSTCWQGDSYRGFGAAAHSFDGRHRFWNHSDIAAYIRDVQGNRPPVEETEKLSGKQQMLERVMLGLRTRDGIDVPGFESGFNQSFESMFSATIQQVTGNGLGGFHQDRFSLNLKGMMRLNAIVEAFAEKIL
jgi:oxygen-independent coproporphyrinogen-3 oxidase